MLLLYVANCQHSRRHRTKVRSTLRTPIFIFYVIYFGSSLQKLKDDIKAGSVPIHGVDIGGWLVAEHWMTSSSPAWNGVPDDTANQGEYRTMKYLGIFPRLM